MYGERIRYRDIQFILFNEKIICYYLGRIRPSDMRNRFNSIRYKESDSNNKVYR